MPKSGPSPMAALPGRAVVIEAGDVLALALAHHRQESTKGDKRVHHSLLTYASHTVMQRICPPASSLKSVDLGRIQTIGTS
jgi:hypothetical protein